MSGSELIVYSDGGCSGNPGPGGWGFIIVDEEVPGGRVADPASQESLAALAVSLTAGVDREVIRSGGDSMTTNNRMELIAVIEALTLVISTPAWAARSVAVYTDSQYVQKGISQWIVGWKRNGWRTASKEPVKNQDLWMRLDSLAQEILPRWVWVKGHAGIHYNEVCDRLTQEEIARHR